MSIETYGTGERLRGAARLAEALGAAHLVLLPVPSSRDGIHVTNTDIPLADTLCNAEGGSVVVGYGLPDGYKNAAQERSAAVLDLSLDEEFLLLNSRITAKGALGYILTTSRKTPEDMAIGIVGYGRIGSSLAEQLLYLGAKLRIYTSKPLTRIKLGEQGIESADSGGKLDLAGLDMLINTAPMNMRKAIGDKIPDGLRVLELASGNNFAEGTSIEALPALPERMYPESAALAYVNAIKRFIEAHNN